MILLIAPFFFFVFFFLFSFSLFFFCFPSCELFEFSLQDLVIPSGGYMVPMKKTKKKKRELTTAPVYQDH